MAPALADTKDARQRWGDLRLRVISAAVLAPAALICVWVGGMMFILLVAAATIGMAVEWRGMVRARRPVDVRWLLCGLAYILLAAIALAWLRGSTAIGRANILFLLALVWSTDIGAYLAGRLIGGPRLAPAISPGKTVSGAIGGLAGAILVGVVASPAVPVSVVRAALLAGSLGIVAQAGDLLESWAKRRFGVKDSGHLIPGHGGLLDRLDSLLAVAIAGGLLALLAGPGVVLWK